MEDIIMRFDAITFLENLFKPSVTPPGTIDSCVQKDLAIFPEHLPGITPADLPPDWHFLWDERAAIMEYDGGMSKEDADAAALKDILRQMKESGISLPGT
jgi:hypothetical protein